MATQVWANGATSLVTGTFLTGATSLTFTLADDAKFPNPTGSEYFICAVTKVDGSYEIIKVTQHTAASGTFQVVERAQEGTSQLNIVAGDVTDGVKVELIVSKGAMDDVARISEDNAFTGSATFSGSVTFSGATVLNVEPTGTYAPWTTGDVKLTLKTSADTGWVLFNDLTIGNAASGASGRANADTEDLFTLLWTNTADAQCPVSSGRGASAAADYAANKTIALPKALGRALAQYGTGTQAETYTGVTATTNTLPIASNNTKWITGMPVTLSAVSGFGSLANGSYYIIRVNATTISFATTLALAQAGTATTVTGTGNFTMTYSLTARALGEVGGEDAHAMSINELLSHTHSGAAGGPNIAGSMPETSANTNLDQYSVKNTGGNAAMNIVQPTLFLNTMVKL